MISLSACNRAGNLDIVFFFPTRAHFGDVLSSGFIQQVITHSAHQQSQNYSRSFLLHPLTAPKPATRNLQRGHAGHASRACCARLPGLYSLTLQPLAGLHVTKLGRVALDVSL